MNKPFEVKDFAIITMITSVWIHVAEVARAILVAYPRMEAFFDGKIELILLDQIDLRIALIWVFWDTLLAAVLVFIFWLCSQVFGNNTKSIIISGTITSVATIGIFWIATVNIGLGEWPTAFMIFPIAWVEFIVGALIASKLYARNTAG